jgi:CRP/FNR family transcriptional regulator, cyclic AMP receptor protein
MPVPRDKRHEDRYWNLLDEAEQAALREIGQPGEFQPGDVLCAEGEQTTHVFVLMVGLVKISTAVDGREQVLGLRGRGDIIGELAAESAGSRTATVKAIDIVQALIVPDGRFSQFLDAHRGADRAYRTVLTRRWGEATDIIRSRSVRSGPQRLAACLIDLAERHGTPGDSGIIITIPLSQEEIASIAGVSRATATRALREWRRRGLIRTSRHRLTITNITPLRRIAHREPRSSGQPAN